MGPLELLLCLVSSEGNAEARVAKARVDRVTVFILSRRSVRLRVRMRREKSEGAPSSEVEHLALLRR